MRPYGTNRWRHVGKGQGFSPRGDTAQAEACGSRTWLGLPTGSIILRLHLPGRRRRLIEGRGDDGGVEAFELERLDSGLRPKFGHQV